MESNVNLDKTWDKILASVRVGVSEATFGGYFRNTRLLELREGGDRVICEVACQSAFVRDVLDKRYVGQLAEEAGRIMGKKCEITFKIQGTGHRVQEEKQDLGPLFEAGRTDPDAAKRSKLRPNYTFENYAVGGSNQMAFAAAQAVARRPGLAYNPLFIYGGVGVGKTHLMQAIGHEVIKNGEPKVLFCPGEEFTNDLVEAIRFKSTDKVRAKYRRVKLLLIDDVQFIAGKPSVQEEFFHTYNALQREGGQIVMTSDKPPAEISKLEARLRSRFGAGLIVDIGQPDFELRTAILLIKAKEKERELPMNVAQLIAEHVEGVRELEGFLTRLISEIEAGRGTLGEETVERLLNLQKAGPEGARIVTPTDVISLVGSYFGVGVQQLKGDRRTRTIAWPRQILMFLLREELKLPLEEVGRLIGGRDHSTVVYAEGKVRVLLETDEGLKNQIQDIKRKLLIF